MDFNGCYEEYWPVLEDVCRQVDKDCQDLGLCDADVNICGTLYHDAGVSFGNVIQELHKIVMEQVDENPDWIDLYKKTIFNIHVFLLN